MVVFFSVGLIRPEIPRGDVESKTKGIQSRSAVRDPGATVRFCRRGRRTGFLRQLQRCSKQFWDGRGTNRSTSGRVP